jgi:hypothetical protein
MSCGCRLSKDELIRTRKASKCCPHHKDTGRVKHIEKRCVDCNTLMILKSNQTKRERCPACRKAHIKLIQENITKRRKALRRKQREEELQKKQQIRNEREMLSANAWDCAHRDECLKKAPIDAEYLPCYKCERYCPCDSLMVA